VGLFGKKKRKNKQPPSEGLSVWMDPYELSQMHAVIAAIAPRVGLEWGSGGSTKWMLENVPSLERYVSIEHNEAWYEKVRDQLDDDRLILEHVMPNVPSPGPTWQTRAEHRAVKAWRLACEQDPSYMVDYVARPRQLDVGPYDFILVDGRARCPCMREGMELLRPGGVMVLHDGQREEYRATCDALGAVFLEPWASGQIVVMRKPER
jgi:hypothetical protein